MQSKLNEILELCIEKSKDQSLYEFKYNPYLDKILIIKWKNFSYCEDFVGSPELALEYMQNE